MRAAQLWANVYMAMLIEAPFDAAHQGQNTLLASYTAPEANISTVNMTSMLYYTTSTPMAVYNNFTLTTQLTIPATNTTPARTLSYMDGSLPWPRLCVSGAEGLSGEGPLAPADIFSLNTTVTPFWLADSPATLATALDGWANLSAAAATADTPRLGLPQGVMLVESVSLVSAMARVVNASAARVISWDTLLVGPFNHVPATAKAVTLDMGHGSTGDGQFVIAPPTPNVTHLMIYKLILRYLSMQDLPGTVISTALPMWDFGREALSVAAAAAHDSGSTATGNSFNADMQLQLQNCTLWVPVPDFAALLSAALRGPSWKSGAVTTARLLSQVSVFKPLSSLAQPLTPYSESLTLAQFVGWGWQGTNIVIVPDGGWYGGCQQLLDIAGSAACGQAAGDNGDDTHERSRNEGIGIGVGVGVGATFLLALLAVGAVLVRHRHRCGGQSSCQVSFAACDLSCCVELQLPACFLWADTGLC